MLYKDLYMGKKSISSIHKQLCLVDYPTSGEKTNRSNMITPSICCSASALVLLRYKERD